MREFASVKRDGGGGNEELVFEMKASKSEHVNKLYSKMVRE